MINTGALPVQLNQIESQEVSATLGKDSLHEALIAGIVGLGLILLYMLIYYRFLGLVADIALVIYGILLLGLFNAVHVTLTLPGIAGMILTIGVAADANVVIFERIKEEVRHGRTVRSAVNSGYARGFRTILDANVLTLLTAAVIFEFATAQPKGFRLHPHARCAGQHVHRRGRHARHAGPAVRLHLLQPRRVHGCARLRHRGRRRRRRPRRRSRPRPATGNGRPGAVLRAGDTAGITRGGDTPSRPAAKRRPSTARKKKK